MKYSLTALAVLAPELGSALVGNSWSFTGQPAGGLKDVTFPFNMAGASHTSGYYFAQQFNFYGVDSVGYCGIQNRPNKNGKSIVHGVFSSFQKGATTSDPNCHAGADGGPGVSCAVDFEGDYGVTYNIVVENAGGTKWKGTAVNTATGKSVHIGSWTLPTSAKGIRSSQVGFVEYYPWNSGSHKCSDLPKTSVTMFNPTSRTAGAGTGSIGKPYEYGDCVGKVNFSTTKVTGGYKITVGF
ncbi:hypothetical protein J3459_016971 [Metarhizium acridum]|uniref:Uncharacterized protein n=1 Tax=Metarhizium acridum (strain CQMa 102) TaxID=655827 RepID=E9EID9_METAQ|nr:uncharacterized protein MAC_09637 [Metarhizium acridum CQMa 102]EFY84314.1 hypothetical protein MAC_09637 [Metarhizium acridum CQMa 102]KAG8410682.1 hypothetical protein J3459_016971 [Metarhizium acridum]KAG8411546.1 hypothetical protein J3458_015603 [Metarhizium acridum]